MIDPGYGKLIAPEIETVFPLMFEQSKNGLPEGENFDACYFQSPPMSNANAAKNVVGALQLTGAITGVWDKDG